MIRTALPPRSSSPVAQKTLTDHSMRLSEQANSPKGGATGASKPPIFLYNEKDQHEPSSLPLSRRATRISIEETNISAAESTEKTNAAFMPRTEKASDLKEEIDFNNLGKPITANCCNSVHIKDGWVYKIFLLSAAAKTERHVASPQEIERRENKHYENETKRLQTNAKTEAEYMQMFYDIPADNKNNALNADFFKITTMRNYDYTDKEEKTATQHKCIVLIMPQIRGTSIPTAIEDNPALAKLMLQNIGKLDRITQKLEEKK